MAVLDVKERKASETLPGGRFPMPDASHARNALARLNQAHGLSEEQKEEVRSRAERMIHHSGGEVDESKKTHEMGHAKHHEKKESRK